MGGKDVGFQVMDAYKYKRLADDVDADLGAMVDEYNHAVLLLKNNEKTIRIRLLIAFSFLEVICNIYNSYFDLKLNNSAVLKKWMKDYCFTEENQIYKTHPYLHKVSEENLYKFRNSIFHAFGLPEPENGVSFTVPNGDETADVIQKMDAGFSRLGHSVVFVSADQLMHLFISGYRIMHPQIFKP